MFPKNIQEELMTAIQVTSEINKLEKVLVHRPGDELLNLTPNT